MVLQSVQATMNWWADCLLRIMSLHVCSSKPVCAILCMIRSFGCSFNDIESEMSSKAVSLIFTLVPQVFERFDMMERPVVLSIELVSVIIKWGTAAFIRYSDGGQASHLWIFFRSCSLSPEQIQQQTVIIHKLGEMLPILSVQYTSANADFLSFLEHTLKLCRLVIKYTIWSYALLHWIVVGEVAAMIWVWFQIFSDT